MDSELVRALRKLISGWQWSADNAATNGDNSGSALLRICAQEAENLLAAHDAREGECPEHPCSLAEALNVIETWGVCGGKLRGDYALRFRALVDRIAPQPQPSVADDAQRAGGINIEHDQPCAQATAQDVRDSFVASWAAAGYALKPNGCAAPMADLDDLPESVRAAIRTMSGEAGGNRDDAYDVIEAELLRLTGRVKDLKRENVELHSEVDLVTHKVITCGVAARHPDANLSRTGAYAQEWNSQQANNVRALRDAKDRAESELAALKARIAEAPTHVAEWTLAYGLTFNDADGTLDGHRVALLDMGKEG